MNTIPVSPDRLQVAVEVALSGARSTSPHFPEGSWKIRHHRVDQGIIPGKIGARFSRAFPKANGGPNDSLSILERVDLIFPSFRPLRGLDGINFGGCRLAQGNWGLWLISYCPINVDPRRALTDVSLATGCFHYQWGEQWPNVWKPGGNTACLFWATDESPPARSWKKIAGRVGQVTGRS